MQTITLFHESANTTAEGAVWTPFIEDGPHPVVGFRVTRPDRVNPEYIFLNPSNPEDTGVTDAFIYQGSTPDPSMYSGAECFINIFGGTPAPGFDNDED
jgi:hypothetical protein